MKPLRAFPSGQLDRMVRSPFPISMRMRSACIDRPSAASTSIAAAGTLVVAVGMSVAARAGSLPEVPMTSVVIGAWMLSFLSGLL